MSVFQDIAKNNRWGSSETISGGGSTLFATEMLRDTLVRLFTQLNIRTLVDAPCGDMNWMRHVKYPFEKYIGVDVVPMIIDQLRTQEFPSQYHFQVGNIVTDILPAADAVLCRECLVHLPFTAIYEAYANWKKAGFNYVFATTFPEETENMDCAVGDWRPLNMEIGPFHWGKPQILVREHTVYSGRFSDKSIGVWRLK